MLTVLGNFRGILIASKIKNVFWQFFYASGQIIIAANLRKLQKFGHTVPGHLDFFLEQKQTKDVIWNIRYPDRRFKTNKHKSNP